MKKLLAVLLTLAMVFGLVACTAAPAATTTETKTEAAPAGDIEIAVVLKTLASEYWGYVKDGCDEAAKEFGVKVTVVGPGAESDIEGQVAMIEQQIGAGCSAIVCAPNDAAAAGAALQAALDAGIPVLAVDTNVGIAGQTSFVGTMNDVAAKEGGLWAAEQLGAGAKAVIIYGQEGDNTSNLRRAGYEAAINETGMVLLDALSCQNTTDGATKTMEDLLTKHGGDIDVVVCHNDDTAIGAMNACKSAGIEDIIIVGFDGNQSAKDLIDAGELIKATVCQQPHAMGYEVVKAALAAINGEKVEETIAAPVEIYAAADVAPAAAAEEPAAEPAAAAYQKLGLDLKNKSGKVVNGFFVYVSGAEDKGASLINEEWVDEDANPETYERFEYVVRDAAAAYDVYVTYTDGTDALAEGVALTGYDKISLKGPEAGDWKIEALDDAADIAACDELFAAGKTSDNTYPGYAVIGIELKNKTEVELTGFWFGEEGVDLKATYNNMLDGHMLDAENGFAPALNEDGTPVTRWLPGKGGLYIFGFFIRPVSEYYAATIAWDDGELTGSDTNFVPEYQTQDYLYNQLSLKSNTDETEWKWAYDDSTEDALPYIAAAKVNGIPADGWYPVY